MAANKLKVIPDILEEHFEELVFLWGQRQEALRSPEYVLPELLELEERIEAHVQGLLVGAEHTIPFVEEGLSQDDPLEVFAAAYTLLRLNIDSGARQVLDAFLQAEEEQLDGIREALCHGPVGIIGDRLEEAFNSAPAPVAVACAEVLAFHSRLDRKAGRLVEFTQDENPQVHRATWRVVSLSFGPGPLAPELSSVLCDTAVNDEDSSVRCAALYAAARTRQPWLLEHCRRLADEPKPDDLDAILLLAILGKPLDLERLLAVARRADLGSLRLRVLGAFGHPSVVETLLEEMQSDDPPTAVAAGAAFTKITGEEFESDKTVQVPPEDGSEPDDFEKEFLEEVTVPDVQLARAHWQECKDAYSSGTRWRRGQNVTHGVSNEVMAQLDMESRWEACLGGMFEGTWQGSAVNLEKFPQKRQ